MSEAEAKMAFLFKETPWDGDDQGISSSPRTRVRVTEFSSVDWKIESLQLRAEARSGFPDAEAHTPGS